MLKSTLSLCFAALSLAAVAQEFTPVSEITESGWYKMRMVTSNQNSEVSLTAPLYVYSTGIELEQNASTAYPFVASATPAASEAANYVYIEKVGSTYSILSPDGHYANGAAKSARAAFTSLAITSKNAANNTFTIKGGGTFWDCYNNYVGAYGASSNTSYQFSKATDIDNYDIYTVNITDGFSGSHPGKDSFVLINSAASKGVPRAYNGGKLFFEKDADVKSTDFAAPGTATQVASVKVDKAAKTINITMEDLQEGGVYMLTNVQKDGTLFPIYMDADAGLQIGTAGTDYGTQAMFTLAKDGDKVALVSAACGQYWGYTGRDASGHDGAEETYDADHCGLTMVSANGTLAGTYYMYAQRYAAAKAGSFVILKGTKAWDGYSDKVAYEANYSNLFYVQRVDTYPYNTVNLQAKNGKHYASVYVPFAFNIPADVKAFYGYAVSPTDVELHEVEGGVVPKGQAVVLRSASVQGEQLLVPSLTQPDAVLENKLQGTITPAAVGSAAVYAFTGKYDDLGFYQWTGANYPLGKAYLVLDPGTAVMGFSLRFAGEAATGIDHSLTDAAQGQRAVYDLSGRRVQQPAHGVYLVNGKKVWVK